jgi:hypothetical protein
LENENWFFRLVWRFNALVIASLAAVLLALFGGNFVNEFFLAKPTLEKPENFVSGQKSKSASVTYSLGSHERLDGTPYVLAILTRTSLPATQRFALSSGRSSDRDETTVNYLLLDGRTAAGRWLLPGLNHAVSHVELRTSAPVSDVSHETVTALLVDSIPVVAGDNGALQLSTPETLYYVPVAGSEAKKFFTAEVIDSTEQIDSKTILIFYRNNSLRRVASFSIPELRQLADEPIPKVAP